MHVHGRERDRRVLANLVVHKPVDKVVDNFPNLWTTA